MGQQAPHNKRIQAVRQALLKHLYKKHIPEQLKFDLKAVLGAISEVHKLSINLPDSYTACWRNHSVWDKLLLSLLLRKPPAVKGNSDLEQVFEQLPGSKETSEQNT